MLSSLLSCPGYLIITFLQSITRSFSLIFLFDTSTQDFYHVPLPREDQERIQLQLLNREWNRVQKDVPFYRDLPLKLHPGEPFASFTEFYEQVPVTTKGMLQEAIHRFQTAECQHAAAELTSRLHTSLFH